MADAIVNETEKQIPVQAYFIVLMGIVAVSSAPVLIRLALDEGLPALFVAGGRLAIAALVLTPFTLRRYGERIRKLDRETLIFCVISGIFLAIHFGTWVSSLGMTSILISTTLVMTNPLWIALLETVFLKTRLNRLIWAGLFVAITGGLFIGLSGSGEGTANVADNRPLLGGVLALTGAMAFAIYAVVGRKVRAHLELAPYIWLSYTVSAVLLLGIAAATGTPFTGHTTQGYFWLLLLGLVPQLIGHSSFNYAYKYISATYISTVVQLEPILSAVAAYFLFSETPTELQVFGSLAVLAGVVLASFGLRKKVTS